jgi:hypothetical protein
VSNNESEICIIQNHFIRSMVTGIISVFQSMNNIFLHLIYLLFVFISFCLSFFVSFCNTFNQVSNNESDERHFTHLIRCQTMKVKPYIILNRSRKHVNYEEDKNKVPMNKPYNISLFIIYFFVKTICMHSASVPLRKVPRPWQ